MPSTARRIILELFEKQEQWPTDELISEVERRHAEEGGVKGNQAPRLVVSKALGYLQEDGKVSNVSYGYWKRAATDETEIESDIAAATSTIPPTLEEDEPVADKVVGEGEESVYVYFNPNDRELASHKGRILWECKIGCTSTSDVVARIRGQGAKTALSHPPVIGLIIKTHDCAALEKALKASLRLTDAAVADSLGSEWFMTSPERIEKWFAAFQQAVSYLNQDEKLA